MTTLRQTWLPLALGLLLAPIGCGSSEDDDAVNQAEAGAGAAEMGGSSAGGTGGDGTSASGGRASGGQSATGGTHLGTGGRASGVHEGTGAAPQGGSATTGGMDAGGTSTSGGAHTGGHAPSGGSEAGGSGGQAHVGGTAGEVGIGGSAGQAPAGGVGGEVHEGGSGGEIPTGGAATAGEGGTAGTGVETGGNGTGGNTGESIETCFAGLRELEGSWQISTRENTAENVSLRLALETADRGGTSGTWPWGVVLLALEIDGAVICLDEAALVDPGYELSLHNCADVLSFESGGQTYQIEAADAPKAASLTILSGATVVRGPITLTVAECVGGGRPSTECRSGGPC